MTLNSRPITQPSPLLLLIPLILVGCAAPGTRIMSFEDYARIEHLTPCPLDFTTATGRLHYYGAAHSFDPADPQAADIERRWDRFGPDLALNEGGDPPVQPSRDEAIGRHGEPGLVRWLARRDGVEVRSLDPTHEQEVERLRGAFEADELMFFYVSRALMQDRRHDAAHVRGPDTVLEHTLRYYGRLAGMEGAPNTPDDWRAAFARLAPQGSDWRDPPPEWFDPVPRQGRPVLLTNRISRLASEFRDRFMVDLLVREVRAGRRVFAVIGASHVVMQEPALRTRLGWHP